jgi:hypothetical protein
VSKLSSYGGRSGSSYGGSSHRHFGSSSKHKRNWERYPLTGSAEGDLHARIQFREEAENRLFRRR